MDLLSASLAVDEAVAAIEHIMQSTGGRVDETHLRELVDLSDRRISFEDGRESDQSPHAVSCATIRRLAKNEMDRRGILH